MANWIDYYKVLGVSFNASFEEIKANYIRLARKYHPDLCSDKDATTIMTQINMAYSTLSSPSKRKKYDELYLAHHTSKREKPNDNTSSVRNKTRKKSESNESVHSGSYDWLKVLFNCKDKVDIIVATKILLSYSIKSGVYDIYESVKLYNAWLIIANNTLLELESAMKVAKYFNLDISLIEKQIARLKATIKENIIKDIKPKKPEKTYQYRRPKKIYNEKNNIYNNIYYK